MNAISRCVRGWVLLFVVGCCCAPATALIVVPPATNNNTSAPVDDPGWLNVGDRGVYVGNRWVITAFHVGAGTTTFPGVGTYFFQSGTDVRLQNPDSSFADLMLYRLSTDPGLPWLSIASTTPAVGVEITFIGDGGAVHPTDQETYWNVTGTDPNYTWTEVSSSDPHNASGYKTTTFRKLWGTNLVERDSDFFMGEDDADHTVVADDGFGLTISFFSDFDDPNDTASDATAHEAQAQGGDSGSAAFAKEGGSWVLAGVTYAVAGFEDQPNPGSNAVFGNLTFAADLSRYRQQILSITSIPEVSSFWMVGGASAGLGILRLSRGRNRTS